MFTIFNDIMKVSIIDPVENILHLGSRYCTGGYIWQIYHNKFGNVLSGPHYPTEFPPPFDGQGAPEIFESAPNADTTPVGNFVVVPGVGKIKKTSPIVPFHAKNNPEVIEFCTWEVRQKPTMLTMTTTQSNNDYQSIITRTITLNESTVTSKTDFSNNGTKSFNIRWFAHPFFPLNADNRCCFFSLPVEIPKSHAFAIDANNVLSIKKTIDRSRSSYTHLTIPVHTQMKLYQIHPIAGIITIIPNFNIVKMPVWTNERTFSFEPYFEATVQPGEHASWGISYFL